MHLNVRTLLFAAASCALASLPRAAAPSDVLPFADVRAGMKGIGRTVFAGDRIVEFDVEILGKLPDIAPDQNLILARLSGGPLAETGVLSGMSGSPVFIDGRLVGAVAYSWGFSKEPIAGITPIDEMLRLGPAAAGASARSARPPSPAAIDRLEHPERLDGFFAASLDRLSARAATAGVRSLPLSVSGLSPAGLAAIAPGLERAGFVPLQGGSSGAAPAATAARLEPGSPVGVKLVRGDVDMTATGTVTWVDGDTVLAFGHPLFGLGDVDLPMTAARVEALLPSLNQSARIAVPLAEVGALRDDRATGIVGRLGAKPRMIPVRVQYRDASGGRASYAFDVADDPLLAPLLMYYALNGIIQSRDGGLGSATVRLAKGSVIKLRDQDDVALDNLFSGSTALFYATGTSAYILHLLLNNDWSPPQVVGVNLILEYQDTPRTARLRRVTLDRYRVRPGEKIRATVVLDPYRGPSITLQSELDVPRETPPGRLTIDVGSAVAVSRLEGDQEPILPKDLEQFIWLINHLRRNDRVYLLAGTDDDGVFLGGVRLPNLPPSAATILTRPLSRGNFTVVPQRILVEDELPTEYAVEGSARLELEVAAP